MEAPDKSALRARVREIVRAIPSGERAALSQALCSQIPPNPLWQNARAVLLFTALADEADITPLLDDALLAGKQVALPRFDAASGAYVAGLVQKPSELVPGRFGVLEPPAGCPLIPLNQLDLAFVPGVAFDFTGRRLGRGKGFYDRLLAEVRGHKCGVAFDAQIVAAVPEEPHDIRVNSILTPTQWRLCQRAA
jgi:5-formyltetrahydrofolate cyclo-ligase